MVKSIVNGVITYYPGKHYDKTVNGTQIKTQKYYFFASFTIAIRVIEDGIDTLQWILADHLGSTSVTANIDGTLNSILKYSAFGEIWASSGVTNTDYLYTGQLSQAEIGLYYYNARWYDPELGRFVQADTIVPGTSRPDAFDRYSYVLNNPINKNDPTGHTFCDEEGNCYLHHGEPIPTRTKEMPNINLCYGSCKEGTKKEYIWLPDVFKVTHYTFALENDPIYANELKVEAPGIEGTYRFGFLYGANGVIMQGTGLAEDEKFITIDWINSNVEAGYWVFTYGIGGSSGNPEAWKTVATGDPRLPPGTKIIVEAYPGIVFTVNDTGFGVGPNHIDIFIGAVTIQDAMNKYGTIYSKIGIVK